MKNKRTLFWVIVGVVAVALIAVIITFKILNNNREKVNTTNEIPKQQEKKKKKKDEQTNEVDIVSNEDEISESEIVAIYGMSKQDAENMIKKYFTDDGYEFSTRITAAGFYRVTVKDTVNNDVLTFRIDPASKSAIQE